MIGKIIYGETCTGTLNYVFGKKGMQILGYGNTFSQFPVEDYAEVHVLDLRFFKGDVAEYAKENPDIVANFLRDYEKSIKAAQTDIAGTAALCEETGVVAKKAIAQKALPRCNIVYRVGDEMTADVNAYLKVLYDASPAAVGGKLPDANFYYTKATPGQVFWKSVQRSFQ